MLITCEASQEFFLVRGTHNPQSFKYLLLLGYAMLSHFSHVRLCATPSTAAHQVPPSLGFSRQEHWSGLPFPSPMHEKWKVKVKSLSRVRLYATPWTAAYQAPLSMGFSRQEYWSGLPLPSPHPIHDDWKNHSFDYMDLCQQSDIFAFQYPV